MAAGGLGDLDDHKIRVYEPTYRMKPYEDRKFTPSAVRAICEAVVKQHLDGKAWGVDQETVWTRDITADIRKRVKELEYSRYKILVQVAVGEVRQQGVRVASRCLWDTDTDNYASYSYRNESVWCSAMVFGCYTE